MSTSPVALCEVYRNPENTPGRCYGTGYISCIAGRSEILGVREELVNYIRRLGNGFLDIYGREKLLGVCGSSRREALMICCTRENRYVTTMRHDRG